MLSTYSGNTRSTLEQFSISGKSACAFVPPCCIQKVGAPKADKQCSQAFCVGARRPGAAVYDHETVHVSTFRRKENAPGFPLQVPGISSGQPLINRFSSHTLLFSLQRYEFKAAHPAANSSEAASDPVRCPIFGKAAPDQPPGCGIPPYFPHRLSRRLLYASAIS